MQLPSKDIDALKEYNTYKRENCNRIEAYEGGTYANRFACSLFMPVYDREKVCDGKTVSKRKAFCNLTLLSEEPYQIMIDNRSGNPKKDSILAFGIIFAGDVLSFYGLFYEFGYNLYSEKNKPYRDFINEFCSELEKLRLDNSENRRSIAVTIIENNKSLVDLKKTLKYWREGA